MNFSDNTNQRLETLEKQVKELAQKVDKTITHLNTKAESQQRKHLEMRSKHAKFLGFFLFCFVLFYFIYFFCLHSLKKPNFGPRYIFHLASMQKKNCRLESMCKNVFVSNNSYSYWSKRFHHFESCIYLNYVIPMYIKHFIQNDNHTFAIYNCILVFGC